jgi:hypothetical protein
MLFLLAVGLGVCSVLVGGASAAGPKDARPSVPLPKIHEEPPGWAQGGARRGTAEDRQRRQRSRTAHRSLGLHRALVLARDEFPDVVSGPVYSGLDLRPGEELVRYTSPRSALIEYADGVRGVAQSGLPLVVDESDGEVSVDLAVRDDGSGPLKPEAPLVETEIGAVASKGFSFPDAGITVRPVGAAAADATVQSGKVFYSETDTDTDELVLPSPAGVETFDVLRSVDSPEERAYDLSLPPGAKLEPVPGATGFPDGAQVTQDGRSLLAIPAPRAHDADGAPVPVTMSVDGDRLTVHVPHRDEDYRYPLLVDPDWRVIDNYAGWSNTSGWWTAASSGNYGFGVTNWGFTFGNRFGLTVSAAPAAYTANNHWGEWIYSPPANSYIYRVEYEYTSYEYLNQCVLRGLYAGNAWERLDPPYCGTLNNNYLTLCANNCDPNYGANNNWAVLALQTHKSTSTNRWQGLVVNNVIIYQRDRYDPWIGSVNQNAGSGWWGAGVTLSATVNTGDTGLGMHSVDLSGPGVSQSRVHGCSGTHWSRCPLGYSPTFTYSTNSLPEGQSSLSAKANDINNRGSALSWWPVKVDRTRPQLVVTGSLRAAANDYPGPNATAHIEAPDSLSGVKSVEVLVDDQRKDYWERTSACDGCSLPPRDFAWHDADHAPGDHQVKVVVTDFAKNVAVDEWTVTTDEGPPDVAFEGALWEVHEQTVSDPQYDLTIEAGDGTDDDPGTGVESVEILVNGQRESFDSQPCGAGSCTMDKTWSFLTAGRANGDYLIDINVTDHAGNVLSDSVLVTVEHITQRPPQSLSASGVSARTVSGGEPGARAGTSVANVGDVNGDELDDFAIGAPGSSPLAGSNPTPRALAGQVYVVYGKPSGAPTVDLYAFTAADGYTIAGASASDRCGTAVAPAGDVNGDEIADLMVGCPATDGSATAPATQGRVYVVFGSATLGNIDLASFGTRGFVVTGPQTAAGAFAGGLRPFGSHLAGPRAGLYGSAADVNGDDLDDVVLGSSTVSANNRVGSGSAYVIFGKTNSTPVDVGSLGAAGYRIDGAAEGDRAGTASAVVGDVNGDEFADVVVTAPNANANGRTLAGSAYAVFGSAAPTNVDLASLGAAGFVVRGDTGHRLGSSVASVGDLDGDTINEFALGGQGGFVAFGHETTDAVDFTNSDFGYRLVPPAGIGFDNAVVGGGGDLNDDGLADVLVAFPSSDTGAGSVYAIVSQIGTSPYPASIALSDLPGQLGTRLEGASGQALGASIDGIDAGGDEQPAILIGAPNTSSRAASAGAAYMVPRSAMAANAQAAGGRRKCWRHQREYPFEDPLTDFPSNCRKTERNNLERTPYGTRRGYRGRGSAPHRTLGGVERKPMRPRRILNNYQPTALYDSDAKVVGYLQQRRRAHYRYYLYGPNDPSGTNPLDTRQAKTALRLALETTPCMTRGHEPGNFALMLIDGHTSLLKGMRVLIRRDALPPNAFSKTKSNDEVIDSRWVPCRAPAGFKPAKLGTRDMTYAFPGFQTSSNHGDDDAYIGITQAQACDRAPQTWSGGRFNPNCGTSFWNFQFPRQSFPNAPQLVLVSASSTGVGGGGRGRAVFDVSSAKTMTRRDHIRYVDPNVPCKHRPVAHWYLLRYQGLTGWLPRRTPTSNVRNSGRCA